MIPAIRQAYNARFSPEKYKAYVDELSGLYPGQLQFRLAETPVFVPARFRNQMQEACEKILEVVMSPAYLAQSERAIPPHLRVPGAEGRPQFIAFDFGICTGLGGLEPQLIELQAFPTIFAWHMLVPEVMGRHFDLPEGFTNYFPGVSKENYVDMLRSIIVGPEDPASVVLLELFPHRQKTRVDFYATKDLLGISIVCITELIAENENLYYLKDGVKTPIRRIYNRVIFDELEQQPQWVQEKGRIIFEKEWQVQWVPHPAWFYRISKFSLPFIDHPHVPQTQFLNKVQPWPADLENYVAKPLFSFAGQGVIIDVTQEALMEIKDPQNWILQRKVTYAPVIETPGEGAKAEIRVFYFWPDGAPKPLPVNNLARISKGKMVGVRYNQDKEWVGGSFALFEE